MSNEPEKRQVLIRNAATGESRLSEPMPVHGPRPAAEEATPPKPPSASPEPVTAPAGPESGAAEATPGQSEPKDGGQPKPKHEIETLEQFIAHVYARKGQRVALKQKVERAIAQKPHLDEAARSRLMALADADPMLAVPRQLLLLSREVEGFPALRAALTDFVKGVMLRHPAYAAPGIQAAVLNLPESPTTVDAMTALATYEPEKVAGKEPYKPAELQALRRNAAHLFATWLVCQRGLNLDELAALLHQVLWAPAARELVDDNARLRTLTEMEAPAALGLIGQRLRLQTADARAGQERAERAAETLGMQVTSLEERLRAVEAALEARTAELEEARADATERLAALHKAHEAELMHQRHALEQLRGRLVRRLDESVEMLEVGLKALSNKTPRTEVMLERAEHVVDALRAELDNLKEE